MPLPPGEEEEKATEENSEPKLQFSYVECLIFAFHQLAKQVCNGCCSHYSLLSRRIKRREGRKSEGKKMGKRLGPLTSPVSFFFLSISSHPPPPTSPPLCAFICTTSNIHVTVQNMQKVTFIRSCVNQNLATVIKY